jgi:hypothetical protein
VQLSAVTCGGRGIDRRLICGNLPIFESNAFDSMAFFWFMVSNYGATGVSAGTGDIVTFP